MAWVKLDENFAQHPKVVQAGPLGLALHVAALCYCNLHLTDGFVPKQIAKRLLDFDGLGMRRDGEGDVHVEWWVVVQDLEAAGMWLQVDGGWTLHDYLEYQPSKQQVQELRQNRSEAGRKGGQAKAKQSAKQRPKQVLSKASSKSPSKTEAKSYPDPDPDTLRDTNVSLYTDDFEAFWSAYPKREGSNPKKPAAQKFDRAVKAGHDPGELIEAAKAYARSMRGKERQFVAQAVTWLNQARWEDDLTMPSKLAAFNGKRVVDEDFEAEKARVLAEGEAQRQAMAEKAMAENRAYMRQVDERRRAGG